MRGSIFPGHGLSYVGRPFEPDRTVRRLKVNVGQREIVGQLHVSAIMEGTFRYQLDIILNAQSVSVCQTRA
jgi:hypothetical protein